VNWLQVVFAWLGWAGVLAQLPPSTSEATSPPILITLQNGQTFSVTFVARRVR
jgi:hypothetical protein